MRTIFKLIFPVLFFFTLSGCSDNDLQGSCNSIKGSDGSKMCIEYYSSKNLSQWQMTCGPVMKGSWAQDPCDKSGSLGGCQLKNGNAIIWFFPSEKYQTTYDVEEFCVEKDGTFLLSSQE